MKNTALESKTPQKYPETLEEQRDYYLNFFKKWEKWQQETPEKLPEGFRAKEGFNFERINPFDFNNLTEFANSFQILAQNDSELNEVLICKVLPLASPPNGFHPKDKFHYSSTYFPLDKMEVIGNKPYVFLDQINAITYTGYKGKLHLISIPLQKCSWFSLKNCSFSHLTLENFDRGYFSPQTNDYLNQMENQGKLTLINCTWSGLPVVRENYETVQVEAEKTSNILKFDFTKYIQPGYHDIFADFFMGLKSFVQYTRGIGMSIKISVNGGLLVEIEASENEREEITRSFYEYVINILPIISDRKPEISSTLDNPTAAFILLQNKVNSLDIQLQIKDQKFINQNEKEQFFFKIIGELQHEKHFLQLENHQLKDKNLELLAKIDKLNSAIQKIELEKMNSSDEAIIKILLHNLGQLRIALDSRDRTLIKSATKAVKSFWQENQWKVTLALNTSKIASANKDEILAFMNYILNEILTKL